MNEVVALTGAEFRRFVVVAASVYGAAMRRPPEVVVQRRELISLHLGYPGFLAAAAFRPAADGTDGMPEPDRLIGFCYGYRGAAGQWWHDIVARALGREAARRWLRDGFELAELHVHPDHHGHGLGRALLLDVLARTDARHAVLSTPDVDSPARALYRSHGFIDLVCGFEFPGSAEAYAIMGADL